MFQSLVSSALLLEAAQERVEGVGVDGEPASLEQVEQRVPVVRLPQDQQAGEHDRAAPQFLQMPGEQFVVHASHDTVSHTLMQADATTCVRVRWQEGALVPC